MKRKKQAIGTVLGFLFGMFSIKSIAAHCPLCTVGAGAAATGAVWLGVSKVVVALLLGAFAMSMGVWFSRLIEKRKKFFRGQNVLVALGIFLLTFVPLIPIVQAYGPLPINLFGSYGSLLNRTYMVDYSLYAGLLGGIIVSGSTRLNQKIKSLRDGKGIPYQGMLLTFSLLALSAVVIQLIV